MSALTSDGTRQQQRAARSEQRVARPHDALTNDGGYAREATNANGVVGRADTKSARLTHRHRDSGASRRSALQREQRRRNRGLNRTRVRHARGGRLSDRRLLEELVPFYGHALPMRIAHPVAVLREPRRPGCGQNTQVVEFTRIYAWIIQVRNSAYKERARLHDAIFPDRRTFGLPRAPCACDFSRSNGTTISPAARGQRGVRRFSWERHESAGEANGRAWFDSDRRS